MATFNPNLKQLANLFACIDQGHFPLKMSFELGYKTQLNVDLSNISFKSPDPNLFNCSLKDDLSQQSFSSDSKHNYYTYDLSSPEQQVNYLQEANYDVTPETGRKINKVNHFEICQKYGYPKPIKGQGLK